MNEDTMRARFRALKEERDTIRAKSGPLRAERDAIEAEARARTEALDAQIREIEAPLADIRPELAMLAKALDGRT